MENIIQEIETFCQKNNIDHRFVGGVSFGGLLNKNTTWNINIKNKIIKLDQANKLTLYRMDKTQKDIDIILFCHDATRMNALKNFIKNKQFSMVTIENAVYFPEKINPLFQFVTTIEVNKENKPMLVFGNIKQTISWNSLETWTVIANNISYSVRNPIADYFAYQFRSPAGTKPKDQEKVILLEKLVDDMITNGEKIGIHYWSDDYYGAWKTFIKRLQTTKNIPLVTKKLFMKYYWQTIGTTLSHGKNFTKIFFSLHNKFTGV